jgi:hypothetical protein
MTLNQYKLTAILDKFETDRKFSSKPTTILKLILNLVLSEKNKGVSHFWNEIKSVQYGREAVTIELGDHEAINLLLNIVQMLSPPPETLR